MRSLGRIAVWCVAFLTLVPALAFASGFYTPGIGVRASAMGSAFIGLADDYSAIHWNPAGITQIEGTEVTGSLHDLIELSSREGRVALEGAADYSIPVAVPIEATSTVNHHAAPGLFLFTDLPLLGPLSDKIGVAAYTLSEYGVEWAGEDVFDDLMDRYETLPEDPTGYRRVIGDPPDFESRVKAYVVSVAAAKELAPGVSIGVTGHALYSHFLLKDAADWRENSFEGGADLYGVTREDDATGWAYGATVGILYRANDQISVGVAGRTPITVTHEGTMTIESTYDDPILGSYKEEFDVTYPLWVGGGFAYRDFLVDGMTLTVDAQWTQWSEVKEIARTKVGGGDLRALPAELLTTPLGWEDALSVAVGVDYRMSRSLSLMFGYRNDPSVAPDENYDFVLPQITKNTFGLGIGYRSDVWTLDLTVEYQLSEELEFPTPEDWQYLTEERADNMWGKHLSDTIIPSLSFTYGF
jgi:long-chain fatty acid transport protein